MHVKLAVIFVVVGLAQPFTLLAETNAAGDEILIMGDMPGDKADLAQTRLIFSPSLQSNPALNYLPDTPPPIPPATDAQSVVSEDLRDRIISGYGMPEDVRRSMEAGFSVHLTKPVEIEALDAALRQARALY